MVYKLPEPKMSITLRLRPCDAIKTLGWLYQNKMITDAMYARKGQQAMAMTKLLTKTANKD